MQQPGLQMNGFGVDLYTRVHVVETETKHVKEDVAEIKQDVKEMRQDVLSLKKYLERGIGAGMAIGAIFGVVKFIVPLFVQ